LTLLAGHILLRSWWRKAVLVIAAMPIVILKNAIRIDTISLLTIHVDRRIIDGPLHEDGGFVFFFLALLLLYPILVMLAKSETGEDRLLVKRKGPASHIEFGTPPNLGGERSEGNFSL
jgi:exosortase/archaeosortase family protein